MLFDKNNFHDTIAHQITLNDKGIIMEKTILIVEDEVTSAKLLEKAVHIAGFKSITTANGEEALKKFNEIPFPVVITDIEMPVMGGEELIARLTEYEIPPVIIVQTVHTEVSLIIDIMKSGVYDFIVKPIDVSELSIKIKRAMEAAELRRMQKSIEREKVIRLENELEWYHWSESMLNRDVHNLDKSLFHSLHTAFNQGAGFGALLTLLQLLSSTAEKQDNHYVVDAELMDMIKDNVEISNKVIQTFSDLDKLTTNNIPLEEISYDNLFQFLSTTVSSMEDYAPIQNNRIVISDPQGSYKKKVIKINREYFTKALKELIINACKFSEPATPVYILVEAEENLMIISVLNKPAPDEHNRLGIPLGYENIVFEPFFRMTRTVKEGYDSVDYGLGLTMADKIIKAHNGNIKITNIKDYSEYNREPEEKVMVSIKLPTY
ncbi:MAG TPA: response regulator [Spirochaetota bacterium]|nr:response regulator [Spirochaetota bacterium]